MLSAAGGDLCWQHPIYDQAMPGHAAHRHARPRSTTPRPSRPPCPHTLTPIITLAACDCLTARRAITPHGASGPRSLSLIAAGDVGRGRGRGGGANSSRRVNNPCCGGPGHLAALPPPVLLLVGECCARPLRCSGSPRAASFSSSLGPVGLGWFGTVSGNAPTCQPPTRPSPVRGTKKTASLTFLACSSSSPTPTPHPLSLFLSVSRHTAPMFN